LRGFQLQRQGEQTDEPRTLTCHQWNTAGIGLYLYVVDAYPEVAAPNRTNAIADKRRQQFDGLTSVLRIYT
jgi:hypothetical protein